MSRKPYASDISDEEWHFVAPYLTLITEEAPQRRYSLREVFNALRWLARERAMTAKSAATAARSTWRAIRWASWWC